MNTLFLLLLAGACLHAQAIQTSSVLPPKSDVERSGLHGKVLMVRTEIALADRRGFLAVPWASDVTYNGDGWEIERTRYVSGNQVFHGLTERDGQHLIRTEFDSSEPPDPHSEIITYDSAGRPVERLIKNHDGTVRERTTRKYNKNGIVETTYDETGLVKDSYVYHTNHVHSGNRSIFETYTDNKLESRTTVRERDKATRRDTINYGRDGKVSSMTAQESAEGITNFALADKFGNAVTYTRDRSGHIRAQTLYEKSGSTKTIYDPDGRTVRMERYASKGELVNAYSYSYQDDEHGNWIRQTKAKELPNGQSLVTEIVSRFITYY